MAEPARLLRSTLLVLLAGALLGASMPCASVCAAFSSEPAVNHASAIDLGATAASSHCARSGADATNTADDAAPPPGPCEDDCPGCATSLVSIASTAVAIDASISERHHAAVAPHVVALVRCTGTGDRLRRALRGAGPPHDVLALTTILQV